MLQKHPHTQAYMYRLPRASEATRRVCVRENKHLKFIIQRLLTQAKSYIFQFMKILPSNGLTALYTFKSSGYSWNISSISAFCHVSMYMNVIEIKVKSTTRNLDQFLPWPTLPARIIIESLNCRPKRRIRSWHFLVFGQDIRNWSYWRDTLC